MTNWNSCISLKHRKAIIVSMVHWALMICSTYGTLSVELSEVRRIDIINDYPLSFIHNFIRVRENKQKKHGK